MLIYVGVSAVFVIVLLLRVFVLWRINKRMFQAVALLADIRRMLKEHYESN